MLNREYIGARSEAREIDVETGQLKLFAKAIGETNPIYFDEDEAKAQGHSSLPAPPTFGNCLGLLAPAASPTYQDLGIDLKGLLHAEEAFEYHAPIYAGNRLSLITEVLDMYEKKGGALEFVERETRITNSNGELVQKVKTTLVMRSAAK